MELNHTSHHVFCRLPAQPKHSVVWLAIFADLRGMEGWVWMLNTQCGHTFNSQSGAGEAKFTGQDFVLTT